MKKIPAVVNWFTEFTEFPLRHFPAVVLLISCRQFTTSRRSLFAKTARRIGSMTVPEVFADPISEEFSPALHSSG